MPRSALRPYPTEDKASRKQQSKRRIPQEREQIIALYASRAKTAAELAIQFGVTLKSCRSNARGAAAAGCCR